MRILWLPHAPWTTRQRARYIVEDLLRHPDIHVNVVTWTQLERSRDLLNPRLLRRTGKTLTETQGRLTLSHVPNVPLSLFSRPLRAHNLNTLVSRVRELAAREDIDVVVAARPMRLPVLKAPVVADFFDDNPSYWQDHRKHPRLAGEIDRLERQLARDACVRVCASQVLVEKLARWGHDATYLPNGVHAERVTGGDRATFRRSVGAAEGDTLVGYIGIFGEFSGLVRTVRGLALWPPGTRLLVAGDGPELAQARALAAASGVEDRVSFLGWVRNVRDFFAGIDVGLLPFDVTDFTSGACPIKLLEYTAAGKRTISTRLEETRRMGIPGLIWTEPTPEGIAAGVRKFVDTRGEALDPAVARRYEWRALADEYLGVLRHVVAHAPRGG